MSKYENLLGQKFGKLTVLEFAEIKYIHTKDARVYWKCQCDCGNIRNISAGRLKNGSAKSCGCLRKELLVARNSIKPGESAANFLFARYKQAAKEHNREFTLTKEKFLILTQQNCYYCGIEPQQVNRTASNNGYFVYNGIDRIDSSIGYTISNVVSCCKNCNIAKNNMTQNEFFSWAKRLNNHQIRTLEID